MAVLLARRVQEGDASSGLPRGARGAARHHRVGPGRRRHSAGHHGRGQVQGLGRSPPAQRGNRASWSSAARRWSASIRATRATRSRRRRRTWTWRRPSWPTPPARSGGPTSCSRASRSPSRSTTSRCSTTPTRAPRWCARAWPWTTRASSSRTPTSARPITGTIIAKTVERGTVIASATANVSGGTTLLQMADLNLVQVRTLVDETDIGKVQPGQLATITVDAYPNRPFEGTVLKIEPQAQTEQNVTVFPVLVRIQNREGLLRPGMNTEVEIHVGNREGVPAVPNAALRTQRDVASAAQVLGLSTEEVQKQLAASASQSASSAGASPADGRRQRPRRATPAQVRPDSRAGWDLIRRAACGRIPPPAGGASSAERRARAAGPAARTPAAGATSSSPSGTAFRRRSGSAPASPTSTTAKCSAASASAIRSTCCRARAWCSRSRTCSARTNQITGGGAVPGMRQQTPGGAGGAGGTPAPTGR